MDTLVESLRTLLKQSTEALGPQDPSTLMLQQHLDAALAEARDQQPKVFWLQSVSPAAGDGQKD